MGDRSVQRRLAAVLAADVAGYTRLMEQDSRGTVTAWQDAREDVIKPQVAEFSGKIVKLTGDGFLVEFPTVEDAVRCAIAMQEGLASSSLGFRMGVNLGDIIDDGEDIHGEGVNIAARIESLADEGGINISGMVYESVRNRIDATYEDRGEHEVKNVSAPIRVYAINLGNAVATAILKEVFNRPAIAVLPFENRSGDPTQDFFADGLTEDIISTLSAWRWFPVIARNSTFAYKGVSTDIRQIGRELDARYIVEGSVRQSGTRIRVSAQLSDTETGHQLSAQNLERELDDIFALQDELTRQIAAAIAPELQRAEANRIPTTGSKNLTAWELVHRGWSQIYEMRPEGSADARSLFNQALELEPTNSRAYSGIGYSHLMDGLIGAIDPKDLPRDEIVAAGQQAVECDPADSRAYSVLGLGYIRKGELDRAMEQQKAALELNPSDVEAHIPLGQVCYLTGQAVEGVASIERGLQLNPREPRSWIYYEIYAHGLLTARRYEDAAAAARQSMQLRADNPRSSLYMAASLGHLGRTDEARQALEGSLRIEPNVSSIVNDLRPYKYAADTEHFLEGLYKAGYSEAAATNITTDKPSIAVLPFDNLSGDPEQEYFSDGITEDIITALSRIRSFFVIARNSTFTFKGQAVDVTAIARELGVRYVLEGSVRKAANRVRVTAQLIDGETGNHIWADKYDRELEDIFAVQDEITATVVTAIEPELSRAEQDRARQKRPGDLNAWDCYQRGMWHVWRSTSEDNANAVHLFHQSIAIDPQFASSYSGLAIAHLRSFMLGYTDEPQTALQSGSDAAKRALAIDDYDVGAYAALSMVGQFTRDHKAGVEAARNAIAISPNHAFAHMSLGINLNHVGLPAEGLAEFDEAENLSPRDPMIWLCYVGRAIASIMLDDYESAVASCRKGARLPNAPHMHPPLQMHLVFALTQLGRIEEARKAARDLIRLKSDFTIAFARHNPGIPQDKLEGYIDALRITGVPEN